MRSLGNHTTGLLSVVTGFLFAASEPLFAQNQPIQNPMATSAALPTVTASTGVYVQTNRDPYTGREIDIYLEQESVPVLRWEQQEVTERRYVPQWVHETQKTTELEYIPSVTYQSQARNLNAWNPLLPPRIAFEFVPVTQYQTVNRVVEKPITYQKFMDQEFKVVIPKLVQVTEQRAKYTQRERNAPALPLTNPASPAQANTNSQTTLSAEQQSAQLAAANRNTFGTNYVTRPIQGSGALAMGSNAYPYSPYSVVASVPSTIAPSNYYNSYTPAANAVVNYPAPVGYQPNYSTVGYQQPVSSPVYPVQSPSPQYLGYTPQTAMTARSFWQMPSWMNGNGPLLNQSLTASYTNYAAPGQSVGSAYAPPMYSNQPYYSPTNSVVSGYPASGYPASGYAAAGYPYGMQSQAPTVGTIRPSTAPLMPNANYYGGRDAMQAGLPPSVLR